MWPPTATLADQVLEQFRQVPGLTDLRVQQPFDYPKFHITVDRTKAAAGRLHASAISPPAC